MPTLHIKVSVSRDFDPLICSPLIPSGSLINVLKQIWDILSHSSTILTIGGVPFQKLYRYVRQEKVSNYTVTVLNRPTRGLHNFYNDFAVSFKSRCQPKNSFGFEYLEGSKPILRLF